jgi:hypothetical protein
MRVPELAALLSKGPKERIKKRFIRSALDKAGWPKRSGDRYFAGQAEIEKAKGIVFEALVKAIMAKLNIADLEDVYELCEARLAKRQLHGGERSS